MSSPTPFSQPSPIPYEDSTLRRAEIALCCCPFQLSLFSQMGSQSVPLPNIAGGSGVERGYTRHPLSERQVERELMWLIQVGLLRREVDGQGITDSFRLTPLGRQLVEQWEARADIAFSNVSTKERLFNSLNRWLRLW